MSTADNPDKSSPNTISSGIPGLDDVLRGGFVSKQLYLVEGEPGSGKTTLALQFLLEGARRGEPVLYVTLSETAAEMRAVATAHGWNIEGVHIHEVLSTEKVLDPQQDYTIFHPSEVELSTTVQGFLSVVERLAPTRVVLDSLSELQLLASSSLVYRRQVLALKLFFARQGCTALLLDDRTGSADNGDLQVRSIAHGVVSMERMATEYGGIRRRLELIKYRGVAFREGLHDYKIQRGGISVYTRLVSATTRTQARQDNFASGLAALDALLGGGVEVGTSTLIAGPPGTGKSSLAAQFVSTAVQAGGRAAAFIFEESARNYLNRCDGLGIPLRPHIESGQLLLRQIDPAELTPGEFMHQVCAQADAGAKVIVLDSLNGFLHAMPDEKLLATRLHELLTYLGQRGVVTLMVGVQQGMLGSAMSTAVDASYVADNVILLRYFEAFGEIRQAISVFKKRTGRHERTLRQFSMDAQGIHVGPVLRQFRGVLSGIPTYDDSKSENESALNER